MSAAAAGLAAPGPLARSADFVRVLRAPVRSATAHFALHHLAEPSTAKLSTDAVETSGKTVEDLASTPPATLGAVVPKRHARRAVTRSLIKRQIREAARRHAGAFGAGLWIVRLRAPFLRAGFASAASTALKRAARGELDALLSSLR